MKKTKLGDFILIQDPTTKIYKPYQIRSKKRSYFLVRMIGWNDETK